VHFALIAVSAGLILLVLSATRYDINAALAQMGQLLALQPQWSIPWLIGLAEKRSDRSQQGIKDFDIWKKDFFEIHIVGQNGNPIQDLQLGVHPSQQNWLIRKNRVRSHAPLGVPSRFALETFRLSLNSRTFSRC